MSILESCVWYNGSIYSYEYTIIIITDSHNECIIDTDAMPYKLVKIYSDCLFK